MAFRLAVRAKVRVSGRRRRRRFYGLPIGGDPLGLR